MVKYFWKNTVKTNARQIDLNLHSKCLFNARTEVHKLPVAKNLVLQHRTCLWIPPKYITLKSVFCGLSSLIHCFVLCPWKSNLSRLRIPFELACITRFISEFPNKSITLSVTEGLTSFWISLKIYYPKVCLLQSFNSDLLLLLFL